MTGLDPPPRRQLNTAVALGFVVQRRWAMDSEIVVGSEIEVSDPKVEVSDPRLRVSDGTLSFRGPQLQAARPSGTRERQPEAPSFRSRSSYMGRVPHSDPKLALWIRSQKFRIRNCTFRIRNFKSLYRRGVGFGGWGAGRCWTPPGGRPLGFRSVVGLMYRCTAPGPPPATNRPQNAGRFGYVFFSTFGNPSIRQRLCLHFALCSVDKNRVYSLLRLL